MEQKPFRFHFNFYQNKECEYFPCHDSVPEEEFSCLFCYCPLYALGRKCGGNCYYTEEGYKACDKCVFPHLSRNYPAVLSRYEEIMEVVRRMDGEPAPQQEAKK